MKKVYIAPKIEVVQLAYHGMLAASPPAWNGEIQAPLMEFETPEEMTSVPTFFEY